MQTKTLYNLPQKVIFCKKCVMSNQRPSSVSEFRHTIDRKDAKYLNIDGDMICDACKQTEIKESIDWYQREKELLTLLDKYRKGNGDYDCLVPGSGGKDSVYQSHILKHKYGMNPLTVTWPPILYTNYGYSNYLNWIEKGGFDNIVFRPNGDVMKKLTKLSIKNLLHPFQTFILGQKNLAPKIASKFNIDLVFYGENEAEYGNPIADNAKSLREKSYFTINNIEDSFLAGVPVKKLVSDFGLSLKDLKIFLPMTKESFNNSNVEIHYLGYYLKWIPQEAYYYAVQHVDFQARPFRTQGTYSKYNSIDDKIDDLHYFTTFIKFGIGRATYDASQEIRNNHITRDEGMALVDKFDGEFPDKYFSEIMNYLEINEDDFIKSLDKFRSPNLWNKKNNKWFLKTINGEKSFEI